MQEREPRLRTELLEHKILKDTFRETELGHCLDAVACLEAENARLSAELDMESEMSKLKKLQVAELRWRSSILMTARRTSAPTRPSRRPIPTAAAEMAKLKKLQVAELRKRARS
jgi:hypothetical protein